ncbi:helix-turn-helix domain-containing protein [Hydrogenophaga sp. BPS33]|uniref:helix-turn-helix domain-containing protein n=1 Tax=Hydrogenophaga sp. BPS33 TaxID=2651974 RepID=UPI002E2D15B8|nr:LysR family transcriptional regulator [Hydrogenophaga sp. BPS33]
MFSAAAMLVSGPRPTTATLAGAAQRLSITQPALRNAIKQMEKLLGEQLLTRNTHRLEITPLGSEVLARTDFLVNTMDLVMQNIQQGCSVDDRWRAWASFHRPEPAWPWR